MKMLGTITCYADLHAIMRARAEELEISRELLDEIAGVQSGYSSKLLAPRPLKKLGDMSLRCILPALGIKLVAVHDAEALRQISNRLVKRDASRAMHAGTVHIIFSKRRLRQMQRRGGENSRIYMSKSRKKMLARRAANARWHKPKVVEVKGSEARALRERHR